MKFFRKTRSSSFIPISRDSVPFSIQLNIMDQFYSIFFQLRTVGERKTKKVLGDFSSTHVLYSIHLHNTYEQSVHKYTHSCCCILFVIIIVLVNMKCIKQRAPYVYVCELYLEFLNTNPQTWTWLHFMLVASSLMHTHSRIQVNIFFRS